ncbi:MAG TPA: GNAT family N-acetyltransferase [Ktedonobacteraceae bacterium]|jgi:RimJ/RimL family protein N-acetyltransferase|nr:GNAT family N-acetyltransferase [Ktedonobacteraceae bacterium]
MASPGEEALPDPAALERIFNHVATQRLILRRLQIGDGPAMFAVHGDPATNLYNPSGPHPDLATSEEMLRSCLHHWEVYGFGYWAVMLPLEEHVIGFGGVEHRVWRERDVFNLYYRFTPSAWGQGYASEMARMAVSLVRAYLPRWPVIARTRAGNIASLRTAERVGLIRRPDLDTEHIVLALGWTPAGDQPN